MLTNRILATLIEKNISSKKLDAALNSHITFHSVWSFATQEDIDFIKRGEISTYPITIGETDTSNEQAIYAREHLERGDRIFEVQFDVRNWRDLDLHHTWATSGGILNPRNVRIAREIELTDL